ncbi:HlyD family efflux transporter periplasmic adaptor subunit [Stenotrophomonas rhizophila]|uniref:HlyD family secretion protein n=1 Tax=Stenotrophomonas rhizophila TaxID=216778 RepID=UPI0028AFD19D|nr:HlyD family efflux transporter periplasmic adaptor subunit [Stenotrophomonas rhizophila]MDY0956281.1 HlyD family efflux transporter periplasmic adaptor subunit [Stenotrophomonas rhizophila]
MSDFFRKQAVEHRRQRLMGDVVVVDSKFSRWFVAASALVFVAALVWVLTGKYARSEVVPGLVVTSIPTVRVYASRSGVVSQLMVHDGQQVKRGQALAYVQVDRLDLARKGAAQSSADSIRRQLAMAQEKLSTVEVATESERNRLLSAIASNEAQTGSVVRQQSLQRSMVEASGEMLKRLEPLVTTGYISHFDVERRKQERMAAQQQLEQLRQQEAQLAGERAEIRAQLEMVPVNLARQKADLGAQLETLQQEMARASVDIGYIIESPVTGRITSLQGATGKVIDPTKSLLTVIPQGSEFEVAAFVPTRASGFIKPGQHVRLMYDAYPYRKFGSYDGVITEVSASALAPSEIDAAIELKEPVYVARIKPSEQRIQARAGGNLQAGMTLTASISVERRSFLDWLLEPINSVRNRS